MRRRGREASGVDSKLKTDNSQLQTFSRVCRPRRGMPAASLLLDRCVGKLGERRERRLRRVQAEPEILVAECGENVGRLVPMRIPTGADLRTSLVFTKTDGGNDVLERIRVGVRHVLPDARRGNR